MSSGDVVILSACRTAIGNLSGSLSSLPAHELGSIAIQDSLKRAGVEAGQVSEVIMGQVLTAGKVIVRILGQLSTPGQLVILSDSSLID